MGCEKKNKKNRLASQVVCKTSQAHAPSLFRRAPAKSAGQYPRIGKNMAYNPDFRKNMQDSHIGRPYRTRLSSAAVMAGLVVPAIHAVPPQ
jgi:hypothetical protein